MSQNEMDPEDVQKKIFDNINTMKAKIEAVNEQFKDA